MGFSDVTCRRRKGTALEEPSLPSRTVSAGVAAGAVYRLGGLHLRGDVVVRGVEGRAERGQTGDGHDGNEGGDQAVLDGRGPRFVAEQLANELDHDFALLRLHGRRRILDQPA